jgi:hypothetical protein
MFYFFLYSLFMAIMWPRHVAVDIVKIRVVLAGYWQVNCWFCLTVSIRGMNHLKMWLFVYVQISLHVFLKLIFCIFLCRKHSALFFTCKIKIITVVAYTSRYFHFCVNDFRETSIGYLQTVNWLNLYRVLRRGISCSVHLPRCYMGQCLLCLFPISRSACTEIRSSPPNKLNRYFCTSTIWNILASWDCRIAWLVWLWTHLKFSWYFHLDAGNTESVILQFLTQKVAK